ncbi:MAG TPA: sensor histidine kinase, partial [Magnetospirillum sp.]|nr:sensor histidine kinase [Magnetospirillum sp.]
SLHKIRVEEVALWRPDALMFAEAREAALFGLRFGMLLLVIVGYGLAGLWVRDVPMLLYALYVGTVLSRGITHTALVTLLFPSAGGTVNYLLGAIGLLGALSSFVFLWDRILDLRKTMPFMHRIYVAVGVLSLLSLLLTSSPLFSIVAVSSLALMLAASLTSVVLAAIMVRREPGNVLLKFYLVAFLPLIAVAAAHVAFPLLPMVPVGLGRNLDGFAVTTHIAVLGVALVYRLGRIQHAHAKVQAELLGERKVQQRLRAFVDMVTHEFKTPLAVIDSAVQVLELKTASQPELGGRLTTIRQAVKRLVGLIETCLAGQRYETTEIKLARISPAAIAEMAAERNHMQDRQAIGVATRDLPDACMADGELLGIALDTLIDNAYRYGPVDQQVEVTAESFGGWVSFAVHDRGPGVPAGEERRIFEKYYRCPSTANVAGNGIGLHLVKTIAELHGGRAAYAPRPGGGASFSLTIPGAESAEAELGGYYG